jgi:membrane-associated phospholipid phosphatase
MLLGRHRQLQTILLFTVFLSAARICHAQSDTAISTRGERSLSGTVLHDGGNALKLAGRAFTAPLSWDGSSWLLAGGAIGVTGLASLVDYDVARRLEQSVSSRNDRLAEIGSAYGNGLNVTLAIGGLYTIGLVVQERWLCETMMLAGTAAFVAATFSTVTKIAVGRARPYAEKGHWSFTPFTLSDDHHSFVSGHTVTAFAISSVLAERIGNPFATVGLYLLATGTAWSRLYYREHWFSDVVPAALLSISIGRSVVQWYEDGEGKNDAVGLEIVPSPNAVTVIWHL